MIKIRCPYCSSINTHLVDAVRETLKGYRRRYECVDCGKRFTTLEEWCPKPKFGTDMAKQNSHNTVRLKTRSQGQIRKEMNY